MPIEPDLEKKSALLLAVVTNDFPAFDAAISAIYEDNIKFGQNFVDKGVTFRKEVPIIFKQEDITTTQFVDKNIHRRDVGLNPRLQTILFDEYKRENYINASYYHGDEVVKLRDIAPSKEMLDKIEQERTKVFKGTYTQDLVHMNDGSSVLENVFPGTRIELGEAAYVSHGKIQRVAKVAPNEELSSSTAKADRVTCDVTEQQKPSGSASKNEGSRVGAYSPETPTKSH